MKTHTRDERNREAVGWYEQNASYYDGLCLKDPSQAREDALRRFAASIPASGRILEIGSGPGRDATFLESLGENVHRTDVTDAFIALQASRGHRVARLDILNDELGGPWTGVFAMCVLHHIAREATNTLVAKVAAALVPGGAFLVSVREDGDERVTAWTRDAFAACLSENDLRVVWDDRDNDGDQWLVFLAQKPGR